MDRIGLPLQPHYLLERLFPRPLVYTVTTIYLTSTTRVKLCFGLYLLVHSLGVGIPSFASPPQAGAVRKSVFVQDLLSLLIWKQAVVSQVSIYSVRYPQLPGALVPCVFSVVWLDDDLEQC